MKVVSGNIIEFALQGNIDVIIQGCNCFNNPGAGLAKQIASTFPKAAEADRFTKKGDKNKLGTYTHALVNEKPKITVINAYTQYNYGSPKNGDVYVDYEAIAKVFATLNDDSRFNSLRIGIPKIGAGLAGGDWDKIARIITSNAPDLNITLVDLPLHPKKKAKEIFDNMNYGCHDGYRQMCDPTFAIKRGIYFVDTLIQTLKQNTYMVSPKSRVDWNTQLIRYWELVKENLELMLRP